MWQSSIPTPPTPHWELNMIHWHNLNNKTILEEFCLFSQLGLHETELTNAQVVMSAYLFQIAREKSFCNDYLSITYKWQFLSRFSILRDKWRQQAMSTLLDENLTCEFKPKNSFTLSKLCMKAEQFLFTMKSSVYSQLNWRTWPQSKGKTPCSFDVAFVPTVLRVVEKLCAKNYLTKIRPRNRETKLKSTKKRNFLALKNIFLTSPGYCLT